MLSLRRFLPLSLCLLAVAPLLAVPDSPRDDPPPDGRKHAQLRQTARDFLALPAESQERMRRLDHALHTEVDRATRTRLLNVLYRYADWLERLPEPERQRVTEAPDRATRLKRIKEIREEQWVRRQPQAVRNWLDALRRAGPAPPAVSAGALLTMAPFPQSVALACALSHDPRALAIHKLREDGRKRRQEWQLALRHWDELKEGRFVPARLADLPAVKSYVEEYLYPRLSKADKERLEQAEGHWPDYPYTLVELADNHPPALPATLDGIPLQLPTRFAELPRDLQARLQKKSAKGVKGGVALEKLLKAKEGRPDFAVAIANFAANPKRKIHMPNELWPSHQSDLSPGMQEFVKELAKKLDQAERELLLEKEGKWPDYPLTIQELAKRHYFEVPWQTLPGRRENWDTYRVKKQTSAAGFPEVPRQQLRDFAVAELSAQERAALDLSATDPAIWGRLTEEYFKRKPHEQRRIRQQDIQPPPRRDSNNPFLQPLSPKGPGGRPEL